MLEIRYTKPDFAPWVDLLFAPFFWIIAFAFVSWDELSTAVAALSVALLGFAIIMIYGFVLFIQGIVRISKSRVGKICCRIDENGARFYDRPWYRAWIWSEVDFIAWHNVKTVVRDPRHITVMPKSLVLRFFWHHLVLRKEFAPSLVHLWIDKTPKQIIAALHELAPDVDISSSKSNARVRQHMRRYLMKKNG